MTRLTLQDLGRVDLSLDEVDALIIVGLFAAGSDGEVEESELGALVADLEALGILDDQSEDERREEVTRLARLCEREGIRPMMGAALALLDGPARESAFSLTLRVLMADGLLPDAEFEYLRELRTVLGMTEEQVDRLTRAAASR